MAAGLMGLTMVAESSLLVLFVADDDDDDGFVAADAVSTSPGVDPTRAGAGEAEQQGWGYDETQGGAREKRRVGGVR